MPLVFQWTRSDLACAAGQLTVDVIELAKPMAATATDA